MALTEGIALLGTQYAYSGNGPLDAKLLVRTYAELTTRSTWVDLSGNIIAYNGMLVAVWRERDENAYKNGVYYLHDGTRNRTPDVESEANWHKLAELSDLTALSEQLTAMSDELAGVKTRLASLEADKVIIRRDNESNYKQKTPANNEICLVDVAGYGLRVKIGDGTTAFTELNYLDEQLLHSIDNVIIKGYFYQEQFYADAAHTELIESKSSRLYIDAASSRLYTYNGSSYEPLKTHLPTANATVSGVVKLYDTVGQNTDGTMTQKAITDELDEKVEMRVDKEEETLILDTDLF